MTWQAIVTEQLKRQESLRKFPYVDTAGKTTIGYGHNLTDKGLSADIIAGLLTSDIADAEDDVRRLLSDSVFEALTDTRKAVMVNMAFNLGYARLSRFTKLLAALRAEQYSVATQEMRNSVWYTQVTGRAEELAGLMERG